MASAQMDQIHLTHTQIPGGVSIMDDLEAWLAGANFTMMETGDIGKCGESKEYQRNKLDALFEVLGVTSLVNQPMRIQSGC
jgi:hypothetical protein